MRHLKTFGIVLGAGLAIASAAASAAGVATAKNPAKPPPVPLLWEVSDADNSLFLLGSFHLLRPDDYPLSPDVTAALAEAENLLFELSPEEMGSPALGMQMAQAATLTGGATLDDQIGPELAATLAAWTSINANHLQKMGLTPEVLQRLEPWFAGLMVSITEMTKSGLNPELGLDRHLMDKAEQAGKPSAGLETGAQQIALFDGMSDKEQIQMLADALEDAGQGPEQIEQLHAAWRAGDAQALWDDMVVDMRAEYPQLYQRINVERNDAWVPKLAARLEAPGDDDTLVVVGALHLLGDDGVVEKLRARGYRVERICSACAERRDP